LIVAVVVDAIVTSLYGFWRNACVVVIAVVTATSSVQVAITVLVRAGDRHARAIGALFFRAAFVPAAPAVLLVGH
jgi:hypothetical protein